MQQKDKKRISFLNNKLISTFREVGHDCGRLVQDMPTEIDKLEHLVSHAIRIILKGMVDGVTKPQVKTVCMPTQNDGSSQGGNSELSDNQIKSSATSSVIRIPEQCEGPRCRNIMKNQKDPHQPLRSPPSSFRGRERKDSVNKEKGSSISAPEQENNERIFGKCVQAFTQFFDLITLLKKSPREEKARNKYLEEMEEWCKNIQVSAQTFKTNNQHTIRKISELKGKVFQKVVVDSSAIKIKEIEEIHCILNQESISLYNHQFDKKPRNISLADKQVQTDYADIVKSMNMRRMKEDDEMLRVNSQPNSDLLASSRRQKNFQRFDGEDGGMRKSQKQLQEKSVLILDDLKEQIQILNEALMQNDRSYCFKIKKYCEKLQELEEVVHQLKEQLWNKQRMHYHEMQALKAQRYEDELLIKAMSRKIRIYENESNQATYSQTPITNSSSQSHHHIGGPRESRFSASTNIHTERRYMCPKLSRERELSRERASTSRERTVMVGYSPRTRFDHGYEAHQNSSSRRQRRQRIESSLTKLRNL